MVHESTISPSPRVARREKAIERILDTAERLLSDEGMSALTMQRLATELGYTVGATYRYFDSKEAIVAALQRRVFTSLHGDVTTLLDASVAEPLVRVAIVARIYATLAARRPIHAALLSRMMGEPANVLQAEHAAPNMQLAVEIGAAGVRELAAARLAGALSAGNDLERGLVLWASLTGVAQTRKLERWQVPGLTTDTIAVALVRTLLVGWGARAAAVETALARAEALVPIAGSAVKHKKEKKR